MKEFRKIQTIELVKETENGFLVQNKGDDSDQWVIPKDVFKSTYEEVKGGE